MTKRSIYPLIIPTALIIASALIVWKWPGLLKEVKGVKEVGALFLLLPFVPYVLFAAGIILGWRFNNGGMILTALTLLLAYLAISNSPVTSPAKAVTGPSVLEFSRFLLPLNLGFFAALTRRHLFTSMGLSCLGLIIIQVVAVILLCAPESLPFARPVTKDTGSLALLSNFFNGFAIDLRSILQYNLIPVFEGMSTLALLSFVAALVFVCVRYFKNQDILSAGFVGCLIAAFLGIASVQSGPSLMIYFSAAGLILIVTTIDSSFSMAYMDELTGLPGRRSLNETLINLGRKYAIAMLDIDHFKKFNDNYGHKTGDQVLKMIAAKLKDITGGAKVFRYGGEEFTAIFPGKTTLEAVPHLEIYRKIIETTPFLVRGKERRKNSSESRGKNKSDSQKGVQVTISIGVASPGKGLTSPEKVLKAADRVLYRAKKAGRNRVES